MCTSGFQVDFDTPETDAHNHATAESNESVAGKCCGKCGGQDAQMIAIHGRNVYCKPCFLIGSTHKFRATLGKHKAIRKGEFVLVGHSGRANSMALLHFIYAAMKEPLHKRLIFQPKFLYIDDGAVKGRTVQERSTTIRDISKQVQSFGLVGFISCLSSCLQENICASTIYAMNDPNASTILSNTEENNIRLRKIFNELEDDTAKDELLRKIRRMVLIRIAHLLNCEKVLLADTSMDLAIKVLSDTSTGRAATISMDVAFLDDRSIEATILRPLRDFTQDEIVWYLRLFTALNTLPTQSNKHRDFSTSVRSVAHEFLDRLNQEFHGTVAAIYKTSNKLLSAGYRDSQQSNILQASAHNCVLCDNPAYSSTDAQHLQLSAIQATAFSKLTSSTSITVQPESFWHSAPIPCCGSSSGSCHCKNATPPFSDDNLQNYLCYSCKNIFRSSNPYTIKESVSFLIPIVQRSVNRQRMRANISNFLL